MKALMLRIIKQMWNDKRSLGLLFLAPLLILSLLFLLLGESDYRPTLGLADGFPIYLADALANQDVITLSLAEGDDLEALLRDGDVDAVVSVSNTGMVVRMLEREGTITAKVTDALRHALAASNPGGQMEVVYLYGHADTSIFDDLGYVFLGIISFFIIFVLSGVSFIRERTAGTLERMLLTPVRRGQVVLGYTFGFGVFAVLQSILLLYFCRYVLHLAFNGSLFPATVIMILLALSAVATGTFISVFANNEFQVVQFIPIIIIPQIFFSGLIPIATFPYHLGVLSYIMPVYYGATALNRVMVRGWGFAGIWPYLAALFIYTAVFSLLNMILLRKYRQV